MSPSEWSVTARKRIPRATEPRAYSGEKAAVRIEPPKLNARMLALIPANAISI